MCFEICTQFQCLSWGFPMSVVKLSNEGSWCRWPVLPGHNKTLEERSNQSVSLMLYLKMGGGLQHLHVGVCIPYCFFGNLYGAGRTLLLLGLLLPTPLPAAFQFCFSHVSVPSGNPGSFGQHWQWKEQQIRHDVNPLCQGCTELWRLHLHTAAAPKASLRHKPEQCPHRQTTR